jgi:hypothetical protein
LFTIDVTFNEIIPEQIGARRERDRTGAGAGRIVHDEIAGDTRQEQTRLRGVCSVRGLEQDGLSAESQNPSGAQPLAHWTNSISLGRQVLVKNGWSGP